MALSISENFESYTSGNDLNGGSGGSGWSANWSASSGFIATNTESPPQGSICVKESTIGSSASRTFSTETAGVFYISAKVSATTAQGAGITVGASNLIVQFRNDGTIKYFDGSAYTTKQAYSANTWYRIGIEWDVPGHGSQWRMNVDNGTWTSWVNGNGTWASGLGSINLPSANHSPDYGSWDNISTSYSSNTNFTQTVSNTLTTSDQKSLTWAAVLSKAETLGFSNVATRQTLFGLTPSDTVGLTDIVLLYNPGSYSESVVETFYLSDDVSIREKQVLSVTVAELLAMNSLATTSTPGLWSYKAKNTGGTWTFTPKQ